VRANANGVCSRATENTVRFVRLRMRADFGARAKGVASCARMRERDQKINANRSQKKLAHLFSRLESNVPFLCACQMRVGIHTQENKPARLRLTPSLPNQNCAHSFHRGLSVKHWFQGKPARFRRHGPLCTILLRWVHRGKIFLRILR
jgi:hypothetical protein